MSWLEVSIEAFENQAQSCGEILENIGAVAVSFFDAGDNPVLEPLPGTTPLWHSVKIVGLFSGETSVSELNQALEQSFPNILFKVTKLAEQDWTRTWLDHFHAMRFGEKLWVAPIDDDTISQKDAVILRLDPGLAFGTGTHPTTALCLEWLDKHPLHENTVIDYGCGSGILGIAALLLGAKKVYAIDYDPQALTSTLENAKRNQIGDSQLEALLPNELPDPVPLAQTVLANILAQPLIELAPTLAKCCAPGGHIILSGLLTNQAELVKTAYLPWFAFEEIMTKDGWALMVGKKTA